MSSAEWHTKHGGELCYGPDFTKLFQNAAGYVDQILAGTPRSKSPRHPSNTGRLCAKAAALKTGGA